jgi:tRNA-splicing ligase RtcB
MSNFDYIETGGVPIKAWTRGVPIEDAARKQLENVARLPFIHSMSRSCPTYTGAWVRPWVA